MTLPVNDVPKKTIERARRLREDIHRHPELGMQEHRTCGVVADRLREIGLDDVAAPVAGTGVVALLRGRAGEGPTVALRADMDALPIQEEVGPRYRSVHDGVMHACGHDGHVACLLGAAEVLAGRRDAMAGNVKLIFQPGEEGWRGGEKMVQAGCLDDPHVDAIFALHGLHAIRPGQLLLYDQPAVAVDGFEMTIEGKGGHGAMPNLCVDPVVAGAQIISAAQTIVSRESGPDEPVVLTFGSLKAGTMGNIIPDSAVIEGTIRALEYKTMRRVRRALGRVASNVGRALRTRVGIRDLHVYPPVKNDAAMLAFTEDVGVELFGRRNVMRPEGYLMGGEDFAFYLPEQGGVPGAFVFMGVEMDENLHTARFDFGSAALKPGILMLTNLALRFLDRR